MMAKHTQIGRSRLRMKERNVCMTRGSGEARIVKDKFGQDSREKMRV